MGSQSTMAFQEYKQAPETPRPCSKETPQLRHGCSMMFYVVPFHCQRLANISIQHRSCWTTLRLPTRSKEQPLVLLCTLLVWVQPAKSCAIKKQQKDVKGGKWLGNAWKLRMQSATSRSYGYSMLISLIYSHCLSSSCQELLGKWSKPSTENILQERHHENTFQVQMEALWRRASEECNSNRQSAYLRSTVKICEVASSLEGVCKAYHIARATRMTRPNIPNPLNRPACRGNSIVHLKRYNINQVPVNLNASYR